MCSNPAVLYIHLWFHMEERNLSSQQRYFSQGQWNGFFTAPPPTKSRFFQTWLIAIKILRVALAVTNATSYWKRTDIVFLWHDLWNFIIFWWITVYPEYMHDARIFTWWQLAVIAPDTNSTTGTSHLAWGSECHQCTRKVSGSGAGGRC